VEEQLLMQLRMDDSGAAARAHKAALRWVHWPVSAAFSTWRAVLHEEHQQATNELKADKFLQLALAFKVLTGLMLVVQESHVERAAGQHRHGAVRRAVFRGWQRVARYLQVCECCRWWGGGGA
jgi:hypothetical protein